MEYGQVRCSKCGKVFGSSLSLFDPAEIKVLHCRVCPVNRVYAVCARCADLERASASPCPSCGAHDMWQTQGMVPQ